MQIKKRYYYYFLLFIKNVDFSPQFQIFIFSSSSFCKLLCLCELRLIKKWFPTIYNVIKIIWPRPTKPNTTTQIFLNKTQTEDGRCMMRGKKKGKQYHRIVNGSYCQSIPYRINVRQFKAGPGPAQSPFKCQTRS